ncbi:MAG: DUF4393 domain-containing protein [Nocardioides sp.]|nr:DUF4393 domain-containing protein [Nocardioides sp.]
MTGAEMIPGAAKLAADLGKKVIAEDESTEAQLARMSEDTPEMKAAARAYAKRVAIRQQIVLQIMRPLGRLAGFSRDYFENTFSDELAEKLAEVPEDQVQSPPPNVAVPAMQALGYSLEEPNLKEMYLNLLANASDKRKATGTHPAFSDVIKQLAGDEARILGQILKSEITPIVKVKVTTGGGHSIPFHNLIAFTNAQTGAQVEHPSLSAWIDNWARLGLVERDFANFFTEAKQYEWTEKRPEVIRLRSGGGSVSFDKGVLRATDFGRRFAVAVGSDERADADAQKWRAVRKVFEAAERDTPAHEPDEPAAD